MSLKGQTNSRQPTSNEKFVIGLIVGFLAAIFIVYALSTRSILSEISVAIFISLFIFLIIAIVLFVIFRRRIVHKLFGKEMKFDSVVEDTQNVIKSSVTVTTDKLFAVLGEEERNKIKTYLPRIINYVLLSNVRNWSLRMLTSLLLVGGGIVTTTLLYTQNSLINTQNDRIYQQTNLLEADRRSSQMFILADLIKDLNLELQDSTNRNRIISKTLTGRLVSLTRSMRPYKYLNDDKLIKKSVSPERAQLLSTILASEVNQVFRSSEIFTFADFGYSDLVGVDFRDVDLKKIKLSYSNFHNATLSRINLYGADLIDVNFSETDLVGANLDASILNYSDFNGSYLISASMINSTLVFTDFTDAHLNSSDLRRSFMYNTKFRNTDLTGADLRDVELDRTTDFRNVASLHKVKVDREDWLQYIHNVKKVKGSQDLLKLYQVECVYYEKLNLLIPTVLRVETN